MATPTPASTKARPKLGPLGYWWLGGLLILGALAFVLNWIDTTTVLVPDDGFSLELCFIAAILVTIASAGMGWWQSLGPGWLHRPVAALGLGLIGFLASYMALTGAAHLIEGRIDFPPGKTHTRTALLAISRAYATHGKGASQSIQTMPLWSNLDVTKDDYRFMQTHRRADDTANDPDEIRSNGYFCARVTLEESARGLRILHAGRWSLPKGSVTLCPPGFDPAATP